MGKWISAIFEYTYLGGHFWAEDLVLYGWALGGDWQE